MTELKEKTLQSLEQILNLSLHIPAIQRWVDRRSNKDNGLKLTSHIGAVAGDVFASYHFFDIQQNDIVMDIGANAGVFSLFVAPWVERVYAIEPLMAEPLRQNIILNDRKNIVVLNEALGDGIINLSWDGCKKEHRIGKSLKELINLCGGRVDFLKMDCEGGEWCIKPEELSGIRRIEAEIHSLDTEYELQDFLDVLDCALFQYNLTFPRAGYMIVHAWKEYR